MTKRKSKRQRLNERILWLLSLGLVGSMVISLIIVAVPGPPAPTPTPWPTWTPVPSSTATPVLSQPTATLLLPEPSPSPGVTEPPIGPVLPTATLGITISQPSLPSPTVAATDLPAGPALDATPTVSPSLTITPSAGQMGPSFAVAGDSRDNPDVYRRVLAAIMADGSQFLVHTGDLVNQGTDGHPHAFHHYLRVMVQGGNVVVEMARIS